MAGSRSDKPLFSKLFVGAFAAASWLSAVAAQPDPQTEPGSTTEDASGTAIEAQPAPEIEDDVLTMPPVEEGFDDDFNDDFNDDLGQDMDDFLNELPFGEPEQEVEEFGTQPSEPGPGQFQRPPGDFDQFRPPPFGLRDEVDMPGRVLPEGEDGFGLDLTRDREEKEAEEQEPRRATIRALEKITARVTDLEIDVGETTQFKGLMITVRTCNKRPPEETPETAAFLEVVEQKANGDSEPLFTGWMFASSPGLSALEHPVYDVWVMDCISLAPVQSTGME